MKIYVATIALFTALGASIFANTFTVTNIADTGTGSLRQAITDANNHVGLDTIAFNIPGSGVHTITPATALPSIVDPLTIDGYTQPGAKPNTNGPGLGDNAVLRIEIDGTNAAPGIATGCLVVDLGGGGSTIRGLVINRCPKAAITLGNSVGGNVIEGNFIGTNSTGSVAMGNGAGVVLVDNGSGESNDTIGGITPDARNLLSGNLGDGIVFAANAAGSGHHVEGNFIGVNAAGTAALGNAGTGIALRFATTNNVIGGTTAAARNIISGNMSFGIFISNLARPNQVTGNSIQGNFIGTDLTGTIALGNGGDGIQINDFNNMVGGSTSGVGNVIAANSGSGISTNADTSLVQGNSIGTDVSGTINLGNHFDGVFVNANSTVIGGTAAGTANKIGFNGGNGINVFTTNNIGNAFNQNSIFSNGHLGIDLGNDGVTLNDLGDADTGANNLQNFPVITSVTNSGGMTTIAGKLNSVASTTYRIEFFANDAIDPSGYGEGQTFVGFKNVTTNASGNVSFTATFPQIGAGQRVTATATDPNNNTSEFSGAIGQLLNISNRMEVLTGNSVLIGGFIIGGSGNKEVLLRALGPTLQNFGITGFLTDPTLELHDGAGALIMSNDNWKDTQQAAIMATGLAPPNDVESAILHTFTAGNYTAIVRGKNNTTGVALVEAYDVDKAIEPTLTNISTRGFVDTGQNVMIGGFISGNGIVRVIVRALGPTLTQFGVTNVLADPTLELHDANGALIASNDNWKDTQQAEIQASGFAPPNNAESAIIASRPPGNTTAIVSGKNNTTGNALVEVYFLPP